jgi:hypothetical protein
MRPRSMFQRVRFIRQTLAICLVLYGCERNLLVTAQMIADDEVKDLPSRLVYFITWVHSVESRTTGEN